MAKIPLSSGGFSLVPEGTHIFQITEVKYKEDFGKMEITLKTKEGYTHVERFSFIKNDGSANDVAVNVFSFFAKTALQNFDLEEIDEQDLVGCFIKAEVTHDVVPNKNDPSKTITFSRLGNKYAADGYEDGAATPAPAAKPAPAASTAQKPAAATVAPASAPAQRKVDLSAILGRK